MEKLRILFKEMEIMDIDKGEKNVFKIHFTYRYPETMDA